MKESYSLGAKASEQKRLLLQRKIYGDTEDIHFPSNYQVAEFGCGAGANLWIAQEVSAGSYIGLDIQPAQLNKAEQTAQMLGLCNTEFKLCNAEKSGLANSSVDAAFARLVLIHLPNPKTMLQEMIRVVRPGGRLIIHEPYDATYYTGPDKFNLMKCFRARNTLAYGNGRGSPEIAVNLFPVLSSLKISEVVVSPHVINANGKSDGIRCKNLLENIIGLIEPVSAELIAQSKITPEEWKSAQQEAGIVTAHTFHTQTLWKATAQVI
ncbi:class I SAM-dependent methyltransferase [Microbulbifer sp. JMSA003]|uniref:class I SAM-dependent methyltransferase n=1 Tax=Microbulbifer sp. JMSA003 TaxID=3243369 RepID=UPI004039ACB0